MEPSKFGYTAYVNQTALHPLGLAFLIMLAIAVLLLPRRFAVLPMIAMACFIAPGQRLVIASVDWTLLRILVLSGWTRVLLRGETRHLSWTTLDTVVILWAASGTIAYTALNGPAVLVYKLGNILDSVGIYLVFRCLIRDWDDIGRLVQGLIVIGIPTALAFLIENTTGRNLFSFLGGVPEITHVRDGRLRCQGAFAHPILAGCFWASVLPLIASHWWRGERARWPATIGVVAAGLVVFLSGSSSPVVAALCCLIGVAMFPLRRCMRQVRWGVLASLIVLHFAMKGPVWSLIARMNVIGGSTGWHRVYLIDQAINRLGEWWFIGTRSTSHWDQFRMLEDVTNQYILEGVRGGLLTMGLFIAIIALAFRAVGRLRPVVERNPAKLAVVWGLGVSVFVHTIMFIGISYDARIFVLWYLQLAMIAGLSSRVSPQLSTQHHVPQTSPLLTRLSHRTPVRPVRLVGHEDTHS